MKILIVASDKQGRFAPFIEEQMTALQAGGNRNTINSNVVNAEFYRSQTQ